MNNVRKTKTPWPQRTVDQRCGTQRKPLGLGLGLGLGRAWSGKDHVLRIDEHFNGWHDHALKGAKPSSAQSTSLGIPRAIETLIHVCAADLQAMESTLQDDRIGTVIIEASDANYGCVPMATDTLRALHDVARNAGVVLIFDEIITGFR